MDLALHRVGGDQISAASLYAALRLRAEVFVVEQDCSYLDPDGLDLDAGTTHLWLAERTGTVASYVRVLPDPHGGHRIGRVVTAPAHRGRHLAGRLLGEAIAEARRRDPSGPVVLHAQSHLVEMYRRAGFVVDGDEYLEDGIPHTPMRLAASDRTEP